jgi:flavin reductase (DIM6/NTAB) family NADH-FMN oxidoreductase RutF
MIIDPKTATYKERHKLMVGSIVPRPIAFVSTISSDGTRNLAPFSYFTAVAADPPTICFAAGRRSSDGERKDTLGNIQATKEFVVNVVTEAMGAAMNETAAEFPPGVDEFKVTGLTPASCRVVRPPRVKESPINLECKLYEIVSIGPTKAGGGSLVIGEIVMFHVANELYENGQINIQELNPLGRLAGTEYTTLGQIISMKRKSRQLKKR